MNKEKPKDNPLIIPSRGGKRITVESNPLLTQIKARRKTALLYVGSVNNDEYVLTALSID